MYWFWLQIDSALYTSLWCFWEIVKPLRHDTEERMGSSMACPWRKETPLSPFLCFPAVMRWQTSCAPTLAYCLVPVPKPMHQHTMHQKLSPPRTFFSLILSSLAHNDGNNKLTNTYIGWKWFVACVGGGVCICGTHVSVHDYVCTCHQSGGFLDRSLPYCFEEEYFADWEGHHLG